MGQRDYPRRVDWSASSPKCKWCGKPEVRFLWSGIKGQYCSFRCSAGGMYPRSVALSITMSALTAIFLLIIVIMQGNNPHTPLPSFFWVISAVPVILSGSFIYAAYVGRVMTKERRAGVL